jgi:hypothetical protein
VAGAALAGSDANRRWRVRMREYLAAPVEADAVEPLEMLDEVFSMA